MFRVKKNVPVCNVSAGLSKRFIIRAGYIIQSDQQGLKLLATMTT
jgi:hypothetical protein